MKAIDISATNLIAAAGFMTPEGISLITVLAFFASYARSMYLLNAIAALRANTMHRMIKTKSFRSNEPVISMPRKKARIANGNAKTVCANLISEKYDFMA